MATSERFAIDHTPPNTDYRTMKTAALNTDIQTLVGSMDTVEVVPVRDIVESTIDTLTLVADQDEMRELTELCTRVYHALETLTGGGGTENLSGFEGNIKDLGRTVREIGSAVREQASRPRDLLEHNPGFTQESIDVWRTELREILSALDIRRCKFMTTAPAVPQPLQRESKQGSALDAEHVVDAESLAPVSETNIRSNEQNSRGPEPSSFPQRHLSPLIQVITPSPIDSDILSCPPPGHIDHVTEPVAISDSEQMLQLLVSGAVPQNELPSAIETIVSNTKAATIVGSLQGKDAQTFIDMVDEALNTIEFAPPVHGKCVRSLYKMCAGHTLLPTSIRFELPGDGIGDVRCRGGFGDVSKCESHGQEVAVKVLRVNQCELQDIRNNFCKEVIAWKNLRHPNVIPLLGAVMTENRLAMVSEWMANGNINQFVAAHQDVNRFELLADVAKGLVYIHGQGMIHRDLKGANVLIDQTCHACIADFGLLTIVPDPTNAAPSNSFPEFGSLRWTSPELLYPGKFGLKECRPTEPSDCYALGMLVYEVLNGKVPFSGHGDFTVVAMVLDGERPKRPQGAEGEWFRDDVWDILERCWMPSPGDRPRVEAVLHCLVVPGPVTIPSPQMIAGPATTDPSILCPGYEEGEDENQSLSSRRSQLQLQRTVRSNAPLSDVTNHRDIRVGRGRVDGLNSMESATDQDGTPLSNGRSQVSLLRRRITGHRQQSWPQPNITPSGVQPVRRPSLGFDISAYHERKVSTEAHGLHDQEAFEKVIESASSGDVAMGRGPQHLGGVFGTPSRKAGGYVVLIFFYITPAASRGGGDAGA